MSQPDDFEPRNKYGKCSDSLASMGKDLSGRVPCSILTGCVGSSKATLLNHILQPQRGKCIDSFEH